ncbi:hypothetical protein CEXT_63851 [Caerostris extrusa]|uniref:Uncharacterized protein n=1 Tax=Caerostris extrusa TaxID=172846 RepID=A0AAV4P303_CAEEX|nr:hypothetical protein CEXT_63851 [Caerostris extrusa]
MGIFNFLHLMGLEFSSPLKTQDDNTYKANTSFGFHLYEKLITTLYQISFEFNFPQKPQDSNVIFHMSLHLSEK